MQDRLKIENLSKTFHLHMLGSKKINAIEQVSFSMQEGEVLGLMGKSGSGKSTLMKTIFRTYLPTSGSIHYYSDQDGWVDLAHAPDHQVLYLRKSEITFCTQFLKVIPRIPAIEIVAENAIIKGQKKENAFEEAARLLSSLGIGQELWDAFPATFSGGEQQRVNVARALISKPKLLLIDEPTASLDQQAKDQVIENVKKLKQEGTSVLCITHDPYTLERLTDRVLEMEAGKTVVKEYQIKTS